jgi:carbon starvation protein
LALAFALLAFSTFIYDTLDVCTRLARYIMQELLGWKSYFGGVMAALITLVLPIVFLMLTKEKGYLVAWPNFGTSNQLLASLTLLAITVWLRKTGKKAMFTLIPMVFMMIVTLWSILLQIIPFVRNLFLGYPLEATVVISGVVGIVLLGLSIWLILEAVKILTKISTVTKV